MTASASSHKRACCILVQHSRPLDRCSSSSFPLHHLFQTTERNAFTLHKRKRPTLHKRRCGYDQATVPTRLCHPIKLYPPQNAIDAVDATSRWRSFSRRRDDSILARAPYRCDCFAIRARRCLFYQGDDALWLFLPRRAVGSASLRLVCRRVPCMRGWAAQEHPHLHAQH